MGFSRKTAPLKEVLFRKQRRHFVSRFDVSAQSVPEVLQNASRYKLLSNIHAMPANQQVIHQGLMRDMVRKREKHRLHR